MKTISGYTFYRFHIHFRIHIEVRCICSHNGNANLDRIGRASIQHSHERCGISNHFLFFCVYYTLKGSVNGLSEGKNMLVVFVYSYVLYVIVKDTTGPDKMPGFLFHDCGCYVTTSSSKT